MNNKDNNITPLDLPKTKEELNSIEPEKTTETQNDQNKKDKKRIKRIIRIIIISLPEENGAMLPTMICV
mgnify:FL=1